MNLEGATCETRSRDDSGDGYHVCGANATHIVITPWNARRLCCEEHASFFASFEGFLVRPAIDICSECGAINKTKSIGLYCWCGASDGVERVNVEGVWFTLCPIHQPPPLWNLWARLWMRFASIFKRKPKTSEAEIMRLTLEAKRKAKSR